MSNSVYQRIAEETGITARSVRRILTSSAALKRPSIAARAARIRALAERLNYRPNSAARAVGSGRFNAIGMLLGSDVSSTSHVPEFMLQEVLTALGRDGRRLVMATVPDARLGDPQQVPSLLNELCVDGMLVIYDVGLPDRIIDVLLKTGGPLIWVNRRLEQDCVRPDDLGAGRLVTEQTIARGHRRIGYVDFAYADDQRRGVIHYSRGDRLAGYRAAMAAAGLQESLHLGPIAPGDDGLAMAVRLLRTPRRPTALVCQSQADSRYFLLTAARRGLAIPRDLSLVLACVDEGELSSGAVQPDRAMGREAVRLLAARIARPRRHLRTVVVPFVFQLGVTLAGPR